MKRLLSTLIAAALHTVATAQSLPEVQADFKQALRSISDGRRDGDAVLNIVGLQGVWPWWPSLHGSPSRVDGTGDFSTSSPPQVALPPWALPLLAEWVAAQGWPAGKPPAVKEARWPAFTEAKPPVPTAFVIAGPAVKDGVAQYRRDGADTVARLAVDDGQASLWLAAAKTLGWGAQMRLREAPVPVVYADVHVSSVFTTPAGAPRVWAVSPAGVVEARLLRLNFGGTGSACESWIELRWPGTAEPAVWALLALADPAWAVGATVQRVAAKPGSAEVQRGELRVALPAAPTLPPLRLRASRYEFHSRDLEAEPDANGEVPMRKRGEAWGTRVWTDAAISQPHEEWNVPPTLSAAGSPRCPVR